MNKWKGTTSINYKLQQQVLREVFAPCRKNTFLPNTPILHLSKQQALTRSSSVELRSTHQNMNPEMEVKSSRRHTQKNDDIRKECEIPLFSMNTWNKNQASTSPLSNLPIDNPTNTNNDDTHTEIYILIEDLTRKMQKPCVRDLKMGTRQYGVNATPHKRISQMQKCSSTTSQKLGVRMCGMQVWNEEAQSYLFQDKYFGRDIKDDKQFQDCLQRFLLRADHSVRINFISGILEKLNQLESIVKEMNGYRFYASSLLFLYDVIERK